MHAWWVVSFREGSARKASGNRCCAVRVGYRTHVGWVNRGVESHCGFDATVPYHSSINIHCCYSFDALFVVAVRATSVGGKRQPKDELTDPPKSGAHANCFHLFVCMSCPSFRYARTRVTTRWKCTVSACRPMEAGAAALRWTFVNHLYNT
jgi:hypothetical protein